MTDLRPLRGLRFARDVEPRIAPPYDVIHEPERERLGAEPENVVHLTLPPGAQGKRDYHAARETLQRWIAEGVLVRETEECLYLLEERTTDGRTRRGLLALLRLADYEERVVLPHERTMGGPKLDRLMLTREVRANLEPLFFLYEDRDAALAPLLDGSALGGKLADCRGPDGTRLALWSIRDPAAIERVRAHLADRPVIIADGHHRYETMVGYRDECREKARAAGHEPAADAPEEFVLGYFVNAYDPASEVHAIHRVLRGELGDLHGVLAAADFQIEPLDPASSWDDLQRGLSGARAAAHAFVLAFPDGSLARIARLRGASRLDVEVLHDDLLPGIGGELAFDSQPARVLEAVRAGGASLGIFLNPLEPDELFRVVEEGRILPQKSTFFSPKIPSGLVLRDF